MFRTLPALVLIVTLPGCAGVLDEDISTDTEELCEAAWDLPSGTVMASAVGTDGFVAIDGRYSTQDGIGISATDGTTSLTLSTRVLDEREVKWGRFPALTRVGLSSTGAYALIYRDDEAFISNAQHTGWLVLAGMHDDDLVGCFELNVKSLNGDEVHSFRDGLLHVPQL